MAVPAANCCRDLQPTRSCPGSIASGVWEAVAVAVGGGAAVPIGGKAGALPAPGTEGTPRARAGLADAVAGFVGAAGTGDTGGAACGGG